MSSGAVLHTLRGNPTGRQGGGASPPVYFSRVKTPPLPALVPIGGLLRPREDQRRRHPRRLRDCARYAGWLLHQPASVHLPRGGVGTPFRCNPAVPERDITEDHRTPAVSLRKKTLEPGQFEPNGPQRHRLTNAARTRRLSRPRTPPDRAQTPQTTEWKRQGSPRPLFRGRSVPPLPPSRGTPKASDQRNPEPKKPDESEPDQPGRTPELIGPQLPLVVFSL